MDKQENAGAGMKTNLTNAKHHLWSHLMPSTHEAEGTSLYLLADGARYPMLWSDLEEEEWHWEMLFREEGLRTQLVTVAPFLVVLDDTPSSRELSERSYGEAGCIFLRTAQPFDELLEHLRELFYVYTPEGEKGYLCFYDPRVFRFLFQQSSPTVLQMIRDGSETFWCEAEDPRYLLRYDQKSDAFPKTIDLVPIAGS